MLERRWTITALGFVLAAPARAECVSRYVPEDLSATLNRADQAWLDFDDVGFASHMLEAERYLLCLDSRITPELAAHYHALVGFRQFAEDRDRSVLAFAASRHADPAYRWPRGMVSPDDVELNGAVGGFPYGSEQFAWLSAPRSGRLLVDGAVGLQRSLSWPAILQYEARDGSLAWTQYLWPDEAPLDYPRGRALPEPVSSTEQGGEDYENVLTWSGVGIFAGGLALAATGLGFGLYFEGHDPGDPYFLDDEASPELGYYYTGFVPAVVGGTGLMAAGGTLVALRERERAVPTWVGAVAAATGAAMVAWPLGLEACCGEELAYDDYAPKAIPYAVGGALLLGGTGSIVVGAVRSAGE